MTEPAASPRRLVRFGAFELDVCSGEMLRNGLQINLSDQPLEILKALLERPGEVVRREELRQRLWPADTFVDFEHGLNAAVRRLRDTLGDSAETPRFIETVPRRGYRFVGAIRLTNGELSDVGQRSRQAHYDRAPDATRPPTRRWRLVLAVGALLSVVVAFLPAGARAVRDRVFPPKSPVIRALAVLPLDNLSRDPDQQYFADAMTEALITSLGNMPSLRVISRRSAMQYREKRKPLPEIARELSVDAIVEGSVLRSGDRVRITAQLVHAMPERHLWSGSYERDLRDIVTLQNEVARAVAREVRVIVEPTEGAPRDDAPVNPAAYDAYLRGRFFWEQAVGDRRSSASFELLSMSRRYLEQAIAVQPHLAPAHAWLAACYFVMVHPADADVMPHEEGIQRARLHLARVQELDPDLSDRHLILAFLKTLEEGDWEGALREYEKALELRPGDPIIRINYAYGLLHHRRTEEAVLQANRALQLDPVSEKINQDRAHLLYFARRYDDAIQAYDKLRQINQHSPWATGTAHAYAMKNMAQQALAYGTEAVRLAPGDPDALHALGIAYALAGRRKEALEVIEILQKKGRTASLIAEVHAAAGDDERAIDLLEEVLNTAPTPAHGVFVLFDPVFENLRDHRRFQDLLQRIHLPS